MPTLKSAFGQYHFYDCGGYGLFSFAGERWQPVQRGKKVSSPRPFMRERANRPMDSSKEAAYRTLKPVLKALSQKDRPVVLDVGGYIGTFCIPISLCAKADGWGVHIHSFEPGPTQELIKINVDLNGLSPHITVHDEAISDNDGYAIYAFRQDGIIGGQVFTENNTDTQCIVPTTTLNTFASRHLKATDNLVIKLDTQGHEPEIMKYATDIIARKQAVWLIEYMHWTGRKAFHDTVFSAYLLENFHTFDSNGEMEPLDHEGMERLLDKLEKSGNMTDLLLVPKAASFTEDVLAAIQSAND